MKQLLQKLREAIEVNDNAIQVRLGDSYYEFIPSKNGEWQVVTIFGKDLRINLKAFKGLSKPEVETKLQERFKNIEIY